jgi:ribonucleoside-diphosphate reductase alpha chain
MDSVISRRFTVAGEDPFAAVAWSRRTSRITNPDGSVVFEMPMPNSTGWSQVAADIMVSKYFRKAGVPQLDADWPAPLDDSGIRSSSRAVGEAGHHPARLHVAVVG